MMLLKDVIAAVAMVATIGYSRAALAGPPPIESPSPTAQRLAPTTSTVQTTDNFTIDVPVHVKFASSSASGSPAKYEKHRVFCGISSGENTTAIFAGVAGPFERYIASAERISGRTGIIVATGSAPVDTDADGAFDGTVHVTTTPFQSALGGVVPASEGHSYACYLGTDAGLAVVNITTSQPSPYFSSFNVKAAGSIP